VNPITAGCIGHMAVIASPPVRMALIDVLAECARQYDTARGVPTTGTVVGLWAAR
jgi:hypothetical protein